MNKLEATFNESLKFRTLLFYKETFDKNLSKSIEIDYSFNEEGDEICTCTGTPSVIMLFIGFLVDNGEDSLVSVKHLK